jgi:hypothetical protein
VSALLVLAVAMLLAVAAASADTAFGLRRVRWLVDLEPVDSHRAPPLSVVVAARNEASHIRPALRSLLEQDYPQLEVVVVNDRSEDDTGVVLEAMSRAAPRLRVITVEVLPDDWLGKNHALAAGATAARGRYVLFTDADVVFAPGALRRALGYAVAHDLDHLAVSPAITSRSPAVRVFVAGFALFFGLLTRPWRVRHPRSRAAIGIGAFNLVRREAYVRAGGHGPIRLRPDDDLMLGRLMKAAGGRSDTLFGAGALSVDWYGSFRELVAGLVKNSFAGAGYSVMAVLGAAALLVTMAIAPPLGALLAPEPARAAFAATAALLLGAAMLSARTTGLPAALGLAFPVAALLLAWVLLRSTAITLWRGGIEWRGTFYPLSLLRRNRL